SQITLYIKDDDGNPFRDYSLATDNWIASSAVNEEHSGYWLPVTGYFEWNGKGSHNELMGGTYTYYIVAEDIAGNTTDSASFEVVIDLEPSLVGYAYANPDTFSAVNPDNNHSNITYYLTRPNLTVTVEVIGEDRTIKTLVDGETQDKGLRSISWLGDFDETYDGSTSRFDSTKLPDGSYVFKITAVDPDKTNDPCIVSGVVDLDNTPPYLTFNDVVVNTNSGTASLDYNLSEDASVEAQVFDNSNNLVSTLVANEPQNAGNYELDWAFGESENSYYFKVSARDRALNSTEQTTDVFAAYVESPVSVTNVSISPSIFTPNGDGHTDQTRLTYTLSGSSESYLTSVYILDYSGTTVKKIIEDENQSDGTHSFYWDGKNEAAQYVEDGNYTYKIIAEGIDSSVSEVQGEITAINSIPELSIAVNPSSFSPNADGSSDTVNIFYSIDYPAEYITDPAAVQIDIKGTDNSVVYTQSFSKTPGTYNFDWDGAGLPEGTYYVIANADDALGSPALTQSITLEINVTAPELAVTYASPNPFSPDNDGAKDEITVSYSLSKDSYITARITDADGAVVKTLSSSEFTGQYVGRIGILSVPTLTWDGKDEAGTVVPEGAYTFSLSSIDDSGNSGNTSIEVVVDTLDPEKPQHSGLPAYTNQQTHTFSGTAEALSTVHLYNNDVLIAQTESDASGNFTHTISLNPGGNQIYVVSEDSAGNQSVASTTSTVNFETENPVVSNIAVSPNPAKEGTVTINFDVSEELLENPSVTVNGNSANYSSNNGLSYVYVYDVTGADSQGQAVVVVSVTDLA
ncbi:MAG: hypothetical protein KKF07_06780, partial [Candidatus Margulisbacteria bacterium]|nr:hypothetical protein [Candidatus Margulisiibacteriota bacterium]